MLLLTRKVGEKILIGDDIEVMVTEVKGGQVKIGVKAPPNISVDRPEVRERRLRGDYDEA